MTGECHRRVQQPCPCQRLWSLCWGAGLRGVGHGVTQVPEQAAGGGSQSCGSSRPCGAQCHDERRDVEELRLAWLCWLCQHLLGPQSCKAAVPMWAVV